MWNNSVIIDRLKDLNSKEAELENLSVEIIIPKLGRKTVDITARKLLIPSGKSTMMLLSIHMGI